MTEHNWEEVTKALVTWIQQAPDSIHEVVDLEVGGLFEEEAAWMEVVEPLETIELDEVLGSLETPLREGDPYRASRVALFCGSLVEQGADPEILVDVVVEILEQCLLDALQLVVEVEARWDLDSPDDLPEDLLEQFFAQEPEWVKGWRALGFIILPAMTMLARSVPARERARERDSLMRVAEAMDEVHGLVDYLYQLLIMVDNQEFLVLHPGETKGFRIAIEGVRNNYHLFTLLQQTLLLDPDGPMLTSALPDPELGEIARGEVQLEQPLSDVGLWNYVHWTQLAQHTDVSALDDGRHTIQGEASPLTIREFQGTKMIVLETTWSQHTWDANFFAPLHDALRSKVEVLEIISPSEVEDWLQEFTKQTWVPSDDEEDEDDFGWDA
ncbi:MAG: hypothetical protein EP343_31915 [Deltaproteobacteria bacterium]|nr:MAG: hypothetical protein EP343_31915 [Deltaproteobacteria bacterium]